MQKPCNIRFDIFIINSSPCLGAEQPRRKSVAIIRGQDHKGRDQGEQARDSGLGFLGREPLSGRGQKIQVRVDPGRGQVGPVQNC